MSKLSSFLKIFSCRSTLIWPFIFTEIHLSQVGTVYCWYLSIFLLVYSCLSCLSGHNVILYNFRSYVRMDMMMYLIEIIHVLQICYYHMNKLDIYEVLSCNFVDLYARKMPSAGFELSYTHSTRICRFGYAQHQFWKLGLKNIDKSIHCPSSKKQNICSYG